MLRRHAIVFSFLLATLLAVGSVELFYRSVGEVLTSAGETARPAADVATTAAKKTAATGTAPPPAGKKPVAQDQAGEKNATPEKKVVATKTAAPPIQVKGATAQNTITDYTIITKRNLFGKVQEKPVAPPPEPKPEPIVTATKLDLTLLGTISGKKEESRAFIQGKIKGKQKQDIYYVGDTIQNARIKEINRGQIILTVNGKDEVLLMKESKSPVSKTNTRASTQTETYTLADVMEEEERKNAKASSRKKSSAQNNKPLQLEKKLR